MPPDICSKTPAKMRSVRSTPRPVENRMPEYRIKAKEATMRNEKYHRYSRFQPTFAAQRAQVIERVRA